MYDYDLLNYESYDTNGDGLDDFWTACFDTNGDGFADTFVKATDYNADGNPDSLTTYADTNNDGVFDAVTKVYDGDADGVVDTVKLFVDSDGNGFADGDPVIYKFDDADGTFMPIYQASSISGTTLFQLDNFRPNKTYPQDITGDPQASIEYWECQGNTNRCALYSQKFVIEELTGQEIDIDNFADVAKENGWFTEDGGTTFLDTNKMLDYYNVENKMGFHKEISDIENCLNDGGRVIVSIDADQIWTGKDSDIFSPYSGANHAVEVIGIDRTNPSSPMVILNDSGSPTGKGEMVPLDVFKETWESGDCQMIECYAQKVA